MFSMSVYQSVTTSAYLHSLETRNYILPSRQYVFFLRELIWLANFIPRLSSQDKTAPPPTLPATLSARNLNRNMAPNKYWTSAKHLAAVHIISWSAENAGYSFCKLSVRWLHGVEQCRGAPQSSWQRTRWQKFRKYKYTPLSAAGWIHLNVATHRFSQAQR